MIEMIDCNPNSSPFIYFIHSTNLINQQKINKEIKK